MILEYRVEETINVKDFLKDKLTSNLIKQLNMNNSYIVNNCFVLNYYEMSKGDLLKIIIPPIKPNVIATKGVLDIVYEDDYLLIINKPNDMATIPTRKHYTSSLANIVRYYYITKGLNIGVHFINRLDSATSGLVIVGKNQYVVEKMKDCIIDKLYLLVVDGIINEGGEIITGIEKEEESIIKRKVVDGKNSKTEYKILKTIGNKTLAEAKLHTGKTHQLRLHFSSIGHPIVGDLLYGNNTIYSKLLLHSYCVKFIHPITKEILEFKSMPCWINDLE